jgi:hypothetical protein
VRFPRGTFDRIVSAIFSSMKPFVEGFWQFSSWQEGCEGDTPVLLEGVLVLYP